MTAALTLSLVLTMAPMSPAPNPAQAGDAVPASADGRCTRHTSYRVPPGTIRVFISHRRGSSVPAHVVTVSFRRYVSRVMNGGAWPAYKPMESLKVGAIAIKQYAWWHVLHHQRGYSFRGVCYDIRDGDQLYRQPFRAHSKTWVAIDATWGVSLRKRGRFFRTGWSGGRIDDGWHLGEDTVTALARRGWKWRRIVTQLLRPVTVVEGSR